MGPRPHSHLLNHVRLRRSTFLQLFIFFFALFRSLSRSFYIFELRHRRYRRRIEDRRGRWRRSAAQRRRIRRRRSVSSPLGSLLHSPLIHSAAATAVATAAAAATTSRGSSRAAARLFRAQKTLRRD